MAWLEAHQELPRHPKTKRFARMLKISIPQAVGHLFLLWWWALDYAENGDLSKYDAYDLADAVQWDGESEEFLSAMIECGPGGTSGFIEKDSSGNIFIHDWDKYSGRLVEKREKNRKRKAQERKNILGKKDEKNSKIRAKKSKIKGTLIIANTEEIKDKKIVRGMSRVTDALVASVSQGYRTEQDTTEQNRTEQNKTQTQHDNDTTAAGPIPAQPAPERPAAAENEKINLDEIVSLWNSKLAPLGFSRVLKQTQPREKALEALLSASPDREKFHWWQEIFERVSQSDFLRKSIRERNWFTLDWLLNEHNLVKVLEGRYDNRASPNQAQDTDEEDLSLFSIDGILARHRARMAEEQAKNSSLIETDHNVVGEGEVGDGERSSDFR